MDVDTTGVLMSAQASWEGRGPDSSRPHLHPHASPPVAPLSSRFHGPGPLPATAERALWACPPASLWPQACGQQGVPGPRPCALWMAVPEPDILSSALSNIGQWASEICPPSERGFDSWLNVPPKAIP